ncbi:putative holliday junction DNA helicase [Bacillus phage vB_BanS_Sophrita]|uniref:Holliday junction DNA helicase n=1 Tax=Bacillus phage vB_BanS_Sophrita TaxID=2894790 RepID=A0AAE8YTR8_9CAUD|nr:putative holliday junction DNA helicase [Bacillus phage vB_BanS_Sophrita]UGO50646.1 putative holliday junction DNA helicase [Bacillus phage vB_BanS_Sophrita]
MTYEETIETIQEALALGFSPKEILEDLENCGEADPKALDEFRSVVKYGI